MTILDEIAAKKRKRVNKRRMELPFEAVKKLALEKVGQETNLFGFYKALAKDGLSIIGEVKNASPSTGKLQVQLDYSTRINKYESSVDAISILTEEDYFMGSIEIFQKIRFMTDVPLLRKDFIIDEYQIYESKVIGADCILLIAGLLDIETLIYFYNVATELNMNVLMEVHNKEELEKALQTDANIIGINNRNLKTFEIDLNTTIQLRKLVPEDKLVVTESGVTELVHMEILSQANIDALLIGRGLMERSEPDIFSKELKSIYAKAN